MIALKGGKILTVTNGIIENGVILIENGKIASVGKSGDIIIPEGTEIISVEGKTVTPGFIDAHNHLCMMGEPGTIPGIIDGNESTDPITPHVRARDALDPQNYAVKEVRESGYTTVCVLPGSSNLICGEGFVLKLKEAESVDEMTIPGTECMKMALGENPRMVYSNKKMMPSTRMGSGALLREALFKARKYSDDLLKGNDVKPDFKLDPLVPVVRGERYARIHCHRADDIVTACRIMEEFGVKYVIEHCTEGHRIADFLGERKLSCVLGPLLSNKSKMEVWNASFDNARKLIDAGLTVSFTADSSSGTKWLPMHLGVVMARGGLTYEEALRGVTINPAKLLKIDDRVGSIEKGKDADIAVFSGDPFSNYTVCELTVIDGRIYG